MEPFIWANPLGKHRFFETKRNCEYSTGTMISYNVAVGSTRVAVAENKAARAVKSRAAETCALGQYIILIILLPSLFLHCPLDYAYPRLSPSLSSTTCTTTCKHILVKFLREESCIRTKARRNAPALGRSSS